MGSYNTDYTVANDDTDRLLVLGNGISNSNRSDALIIRKNGIITAPSLELAEIVENKALITKEYFDFNNSTDAGLEEVTENSNTGFRKANVDAANYGNIGDEAVDLSFNGSPSTTAGATGSSSVATGASTTASGLISTAMGFSTNASGNFAIATGWETTASNLGTTALGSFTTASAPYTTAMGYGTTAVNQYETALGIFNILDTQNDNLLVVGNGVTDGLRSDAFLVTTDGIVTAPSFDLNEIDDAGSKALITKEYFDANNTGSSGGASGLVRITEGLSTGYRLATANSANHGNIGNNAVDLSYSSSSSSINGATASEAFAVGSSTVASGISSTAMGTSTTASNTSSTALGAYTTASGSVSTAIGNNTVASGTNSTAMGWHTIAASPVETAIGTYNVENSSDNLFVVGNGSPAARSDAFLVTKGGTITAPSLDNNEIDAAGNKALTTREFNDENYIGRLPSGDTASRPTGASAPVFGTMRYNTETGRPEVYVENSTNSPTGSTYMPGWISL
ncbi:MAG: hypothetical protein WBG46_11855 [Nonlabens sp.]